MSEFSLERLEFISRFISSRPNGDSLFRDFQVNEHLRTVFEAIIAEQDDPEHVRGAIRDGFDVNGYDSCYFLEAIGRGRFEIVKTMLEAGANLDCTSIPTNSNPRSNISYWAYLSPVSLACVCIRDSNSRRKMVELLLEHCASVDYDPKRHTESCAHSTLRFADCELLELLARSGADMNCLDRASDGVSQIYHGNTPLHRLILRMETAKDLSVYGIHSNRADGELRLKMMQKLLELGADVNLANGRGSAAMHLLFERQYQTPHPMSDEESCEVLSLLLNAGAELNRLNKSGESPLSLAAKCGYYHTVKRIVNSGADINLTKSITNSPLSTAIAKGHKDIVKLLLDCGADVNITDDDGRNFLWEAATNGNIWNMMVRPRYLTDFNSDILKLIMSNSTIKNCIEYGKYVPFESVLMSGTVEAMHLFFENGVQLNNCGVPSPLIRAAGNHDVRILEYLLTTRLYDVNAVDENGFTALFSAVAFDRLDCARMLIEWGANVDIPADPKAVFSTAGRSPLSQAVAQDNLEIVDLLLSFDAKIHFDCGNGDKRCFLNAIRFCSSFREGSSEFEIRKRWFGRVMLSQNLFQRTNFEIHPETDNCPLQKFLFLRTDSREMFNECLSELEALKSVSFYDCQHNSVNLLDVLRGKEITRYVNNAQVVDRYKHLDVSGRFPIYGNLIESRFAMARFKRKLMDSALEKLSKIFGSYPWNCDWFLYNIMAHLSIKDVRNLSEM
ncbi:hypothetical protein QAD02_015675 [Eretmocerus hayati]|uniref:Uncharacterized protein n=1 Tax=Eretmocerus hayati TaxID=131215 RepID=A0ACC2P9Y5_9HYME|nr:hypothetical protein QAD02_015675 [Eretmocerus hayati]